MRTSKPITVTLGKQQKSVDARVESGAYASASEVVRAALRALDRQEKMLDDMMRIKLQETANDPGPDIPADDVFAELYAYHEAQAKSDKRSA